MQWKHLKIIYTLEYDLYITNSFKSYFVLLLLEVTFWGAKFTSALVRINKTTYSANHLGSEISPLRRMCVFRNSASKFAKIVRNDV